MMGQIRMWPDSWNWQNLAAPRKDGSQFLDAQHGCWWFFKHRKDPREQRRAYEGWNK